MREIKFRRAHYKDEELKQFSHFSYWGKDLKNVVFQSPSTNNFALYFIDEQYTGEKDKSGIEIYEGDIVASKANGKIHYKDTIIFKNGCFIWADNEPMCISIDAEEVGEYYVSYDSCGDWAYIIGNIHKNKELI